jgi:dihydrofolate reductase
MGKIIALGHMSLDGYMADPDGQINWIRMDGEVADYVHGICLGCEGIIYGRKTYEWMDPFWPDVLKDPAKWPGWIVEYAEWVNETRKVVVTTTLNSIAWKNTRVVGDNVVEEIGRIKQEAKADLMLAGPKLMMTLFQAGLVDEVVMTIQPVILGKGRPFISMLDERVWLEVREMKKFANQAVGFRYGVVRG